MRKNDQKNMIVTSYSTENNKKTTFLESCVNIKQNMIKSEHAYMDYRLRFLNLYEILIKNEIFYNC